MFPPRLLFLWNLGNPLVRGVKGHAFDLECYPSQGASPCVHLRPGSPRRSPLRAPLPERAAGGPALLLGPRRQPRYRCLGCNSPPLCLPPPSEQASRPLSRLPLRPPSCPRQMQAVALPEEIRWLLEGNSWHSARPLSWPLREVPSALDWRRERKY